MRDQMLRLTEMVLDLKLGSLHRQTSDTSSSKSSQSCAPDGDDNSVNSHTLIYQYLVDNDDFFVAFETFTLNSLFKPTTKLGANVRDNLGEFREFARDQLRTALDKVLARFDTLDHEQIVQLLSEVSQGLEDEKRKGEKKNVET
ncbi:hypothetical protein ACHAPU_008363 [Fusarium lateritium]